MYRFVFLVLSALSAAHAAPPSPEEEGLAFRTAAGVLMVGGAAITLHARPILAEVLPASWGPLARALAEGAAWAGGGLFTLFSLEALIRGQLPYSDDVPA